MSYLNVFPSTQQDISYTLAPAEFALFDHQLNNSLFFQTAVDPTIEYENVLRADFTTCSWLDPASAPSSLLQNYVEMPAVPTTSTCTNGADTTLLNPMAQPFEQDTTIYHLDAQNSFMSFDTQAQIDERRPMDKTEELISMFADFQAKTEERMTLIEKEIQAVKSR
jgi:hypothetical protein